MLNSTKLCYSNYTVSDFEGRKHFGFKFSAKGSQNKQSSLSMQTSLQLTEMYSERQTIK